jgi:hypothetical protein
MLSCSSKNFHEPGLMTFIKESRSVSDLDDPGLDESVRALFEEARRRQRRRRTVAVAVTGIIVVLLLATLLVASPNGPGTGPRSGSRTGVPHGAGVFARPTGAVLLFANGLSLDLDRGTIVRRPIVGQRPGDQQWDIVASGRSVVVGWGEVWATPTSGGRSRLLGPVVTFVPAAKRGAVWLVDYPGGRIGLGTPTLSEVTVAGVVLHRVQGPPPSQGVPTVGIPGGLAFETDTGVALWDVSTRRFVRRLGNTAGFIGDGAGGDLAWCEGLCTSLHVTGVHGAGHAFPSPQAGQVFQARSPRLSPDGRYVAVLTTRPGLMSAHQLGTLDVIDVDTGRVTVARSGLSVWSTFAWAGGGGDTLFFVSDDSRGMMVGRLHGGDTEVAQVPIRNNAEQFVVLARSNARAFLARPSN